MSGIVGIVNGHPVARDLVNALTRLDDRGYDCAGLAVAGPGFAVRKVSGPAAALFGHLPEPEFAGQAGIANARWSNRDRPEGRSAPPVVWGKVAVVHTGIVENHRDLCHELKSQGHAFDTEADSEVIPHVIAAERASGAPPIEALRRACGRMAGEYALAVLFEEAPDHVLIAQRGSPVLVGRGASGTVAASDLEALVGCVDAYTQLEYGDIADLEGQCVRVLDREGRSAERIWHPTEAGPAAAQPDMSVDHTREEIAVQPGVLRRTDAALRGLRLPAAVVAAERLLILASGSSLNAALTVRGWVEHVGGVPCEIEDASEWRDRSPPLGRNTVGVLLSRSGEAHDIMAAAQILRGRGVPMVAVVNDTASALAIAADMLWPTDAGPELGAAATKSFTAQLLALARFGLALGVARGVLDAGQRADAERSIAEAPLTCALAEAADSRFGQIALRIARAGEVMVLGRGWGASLAAEAAQKLKQLACIHADALPAGAMRHGALAMVGNGVPVLVLASADQQFARTAANAEEVRAHGGYVVALVEAACSANLEHVANETVALPGRGLAQVFAQAVAVQLIAYHTARALGRDTERPRSLVHA